MAGMLGESSVRYVEWCECRSRLGYASLRDKFNTFVCGVCKKPMFPVWQAHEKECPECSRSFSSPWELICSLCQPALLAWRNELLEEKWPEVLQNLHTGPWLSWKEQRQRVIDSPFKEYSNSPIQHPV